MKGGGAYDRSVRAIAVFFVIIGLVLLVMTLANGGGPLSVGVLLGLAFVGIGVARWKIQSKISGGRS
ncbi:MAG TPA: hypothetical protein VMF31_01415 [Solirubrobacterales bacterium]|nr:hypothetical protein [Solirubrobacterales bacterium]